MHSTNLVVAALALFASGSLASPEALARRSNDAQKGPPPHKAPPHAEGPSTQKGGGGGGKVGGGGGGGGKSAFGNCPASNMTASLNKPFQLKVWGQNPDTTADFPDFYGWGAEIFTNIMGKKAIRFTKGATSPMFTLKGNKLSTQTDGDLYLNVIRHAGTGGSEVDVARPILETKAGGAEEKLANASSIFPQGPKDGYPVWTFWLADDFWVSYLCDTQNSPNSYELATNLYHGDHKKMRARGVEPNSGGTDKGGKGKGKGADKGKGGSEDPILNAACTDVIIQVYALGLQCV